MTVTDLKSKGTEGLIRPRPLDSLTAAATRIKNQKITRGGNAKIGQEWQKEAWDLYDLVGEERFLTNTLANRVGQARFFCGKLAEDPTENVEHLTEGPIFEVFDSIRRGLLSQTQNIVRMALNLSIPGEYYLIGVPEEESDVLEGTDLDKVTWYVCSVDEITMSKTGDGKATLDFGNDEPLEIEIEKTFFIRAWRPHPRKSFNADSPARASLPVLRELVALTMHISAQVDSRLAGAGLLVIPSSVRSALLRQLDLPDDSQEDPFTEALMEAMLTPIEDRASASAVVPLVVTVPDDSAEIIRHISFSSALDDAAKELREESIRRLALGQDCPPELLLGVGGMNHWGAWLVREDVVTTHLEPPLALICDSMSSQFLWPVLQQMGVEDYQQYVIWYDIDHLILRPSRSQDAKDLHERGVIDDETLRDANGFDEDSAPPDSDVDTATSLALEMVKDAPTLMANPGLLFLVDQIRAAMTGEAPTLEPINLEQPQSVEEDEEEEPPADTSEEDGPPDTNPADEPDVEETEQ